ncbi:unnamed protein product [Ceutorhynchus assimilis]|uniref:Proline-rich protein PRCC n=1 Tax=Ceutorhynchus assimilis TaxID=467358 RepID=A0A9N9QEK1_9CUCU|nr:unnamed protein product [Ceutorhynchus assimilis]CAG9761370.1 unnamed protein product [Ceutorhynchus assimilis]
MALVPYDCGSGSDGEITDDEEVSSKSEVVLNGKPASPNPALAPIDSSTPSTSGLFSQLPQAKPARSNIAEENDQLEDFIPTVKTLKEKRKVQITIPSLSDFDDFNNSDEPSTKRAKPSQKGSGLLSLLPPVQSVPKSNVTFVPDAVKKKSAPMVPRMVAKKKAIISESAKKALSAKTTKISTASDSDTDNEDIPLPDSFDDKMWEKVCGRPKPKKPIIEVVQKSHQPEPEELTIAPDPEKPYDGLDNEAFKELIGKSRRPIGNIKLIDINEDDSMPDRDLMMTKSLTDPDLAPKPPEDDGTIDSTKKRKHHITFLAQQAKAKEQELKAAWATSRSNRMMSRAKYGF